ncbi:glycolate oxidase subunit GlcF [Vibrio hannami]|uniref:glycolate oxidase subunit GlcF n=1 Tax=Vibrio hannami TaxID=2717094 RepID=UPI0024101CC9|nr:glycolate oxidase subunit GlcF [Vibrio hannami]MDG3087599.1 glycolate oxidase subunit GlcF [Vibrio hannami]
MLTELNEVYRDSVPAQEAVGIIKRCVHRGFCNATCPTFIETSDQNNGPRGRIYIIRSFLEGKVLSAEEKQHLDLCLACRSCQTTCPASIEFGRLVNIAREMIEAETTRSWKERLLRWSIRQTIPYPERISRVVAVGRLLSPVLPEPLAKKIPQKEKSRIEPDTDLRINAAISSRRTVLILKGCAQPSVTPNTNIAARNVLARLGIYTQEIPGCCGSVNVNLGDTEGAKAKMKSNIDNWWPMVENGIEAITSLSSSCELMLSEYVRYLANEPEYADKAVKLSEMVKNIGEILINEDLSPFVSQAPKSKIALHTPCSLRHGLEKHELPEKILNQLGVTIAQSEDNHICCGSGGTYSLLQSEMSQKLLRNKITALNLNSPTLIATSNASCQAHISSESKQPVKHWIEVVDDILSAIKPA